MTAHTRRFGALLVVLALGAACGDDDSGSKTQAGKTDDTPSKAEFIAAADKICKAGNDQAEEIFGSVFSSEEPEPAAVQAALTQVLDLTAEQVGDLRGLAVPEGEEQAVDALLDEVEKTSADVRSKVSTPEGAMEVLTSDDDPFAAVNEKWADYGFKDCADEGEAETGTFGGEELSAEEQAKATRVEVKGFEYGYDGMPASLPAGPAVVHFTNTGEDNHEIGIIKIKPGISAADAIAKAKADPDDDSYVERFLGGVMALPDESAEVAIKLDPGLYGYGCFLEDAEGTPHAEHGMIGTFTVAG